MRWMFGGFALLAATAAAADVPLPGARAFPESVNAAADGTVYVSNIAEGGVLRMRPGGKAEPWILPGAFGSGTTYGVTVDAKANTLWLCSNDLSSAGLAKSADGGAAVIGFDLATGAGKIVLPLPKPAECNDIAVGADGSLYVTDTASPRLFRLAPGAKALEVWATDPRFDDKGGGLDGIAIGADGAVYVNTLGSGKLFRVPIEGDKAGAIVELVPDRPLGSADGMRHEGANRFITVTGSGHLERLTVTGDKVAVETVAEGLDEPTGVTIVDGKALVAEGRLSYLFDKARRGQQPALPFRLRAVPLGK